MKLECPCGELIVDTTVSLPYKGEVIADEDIFSIWNDIDACLEIVASNPDNLKKAKVETRRAIISKTRGIWKCDNCGRVAIDDASCRDHWYKPEGGAVVKNLLSARENNYKGEGT